MALLSALPLCLHARLGSSAVRMPPQPGLPVHDHDCGEGDCGLAYSLYRDIDLPKVRFDTAMRELVLARIPARHGLIAQGKFGKLAGWRSRSLASSLTRNCQRLPNCVPACGLHLHGTVQSAACTCHCEVTSRT